MKEYIVLEIDGGYTELPTKDFEYKEIQNCQLLFRGKAKNEKQVIRIIKEEFKDINIDDLSIEILEVKIKNRNYNYA